MLTMNAIKEQEAVQPPESALSEQDDTESLKTLAFFSLVSNVSENFSSCSDLRAVMEV